MDSMTVLQETGYERVYRWTQAECRGQVHVSALLNKCFLFFILHDKKRLFFMEKFPWQKCIY